MRALLILTSLLGLTVGLGAAEVARMTSKDLQLGVDTTSGALVELVDIESRRNLAGVATNLDGLWRIDVAGIGTLTPKSAREFATDRLTGKSNGLRLRWSRFDLAQAPDLRVEVTIALQKNRALSDWRIAVHNRAGHNLEAIRFPRLLNVPELPRERLAVPQWLGEQVENPRALLHDAEGNSKRWEWFYPGILSLQCVALSTSDGAGLYAACDDTRGYLKDFAVFGGGDTGFNLEIVHKPERETHPRKNYILPYTVQLGAIRGDWFAAAALYRSWATNQPWATGSRLRRGLVPSWVTNTALWVWNRGASPGVIDPAIALQKELGLPVSVFWHWWHGCAYDVGFPEYLPPREGEESFKAALERAHKHDVHAIVYMNQRLWGMTTTSWTNEDAERFAVKAHDGRVHPEVYNTFTKSPCASMCMGTEFWRNKYAGLATTAFRQLGVDGIYMDQACSSLACYDPHHGHPIGGGTYWMGGFRTLAADLRRRCNIRGGPALAGEGCGENWLPYLDLMLALQVSRERYAGPNHWETIPFFHAVYHGYEVAYGNYSSLTLPPYDELWPAEFAPKEPLKLLDHKFSRQFYLEQARAFVWGQQPTLANFLPSQLVERSEEIAFVLRLAQVRMRALQYLQDGVMLAPPRVETPCAEIPMSRLSIYAGQQSGFSEFQKVVPELLATAWHAPDDSVGIALANISDKSLRPSIHLVDSSTLPKRGPVYRIDAIGRKQIGTFIANDLILKPELAPLDACLLELKRD